MRSEPSRIGFTVGSSNCKGVVDPPKKRRDFAWKGSSLGNWDLGKVSTFVLSRLELLSFEKKALSSAELHEREADRVSQVGARKKSTRSFGSSSLVEKIGKME